MIKSVLVKQYIGWSLDSTAPFRLPLIRLHLHSGSHLLCTHSTLLTFHLICTLCMHMSWLSSPHLVTPWADISEMPGQSQSSVNRMLETPTPPHMGGFLLLSHSLRLTQSCCLLSECAFFLFASPLDTIKNPSVCWQDVFHTRHIAHGTLLFMRNNPSVHLEKHEFHIPTVAWSSGMSYTVTQVVHCTTPGVPVP